MSAFTPARLPPEIIRIPPYAPVDGRREAWRDPEHRSGVAPGTRARRNCMAHDPASCGWLPVLAHARRDRNRGANGIPVESCGVAVGSYSANSSGFGCDSPMPRADPRTRALASLSATAPRVYMKRCAAWLDANPPDTPGMTRVVIVGGLDVPSVECELIEPTIVTPAPSQFASLLLMSAVLGLLGSLASALSAPHADGHAQKRRPCSTGGWLWGSSAASHGGGSQWCDRDTFGSLPALSRL